jgi:two-component system NtrC family response regulator
MAQAPVSEKRNMANILIVDDDRLAREALVLQLTSMDHTAIVAETLSEGVNLIPLAPIDVVLLDVHLPDGDGLKALPSFRNAPSRPEVIIITGEGTARSAELAINNGAWDFLQKPLTKQEIQLQVTRALEYRVSKIEYQQKELVTLKRAQIIGDSAELTARLDLVAQCAASDANVLITGETGTGKEGFAQVIHQNSLVADNRFVVVDCTSLPEQLVESTLFGHIKGTFTGAETDRVGLVEQAHGGTLFLDEVGELPLSIQKKFLRVLQERCFKRVGGTREMKSDFRLVSATNRDLDKMVAKNQFREDLLYRLRTFHIDLPPLRSCKQDIRALMLFYIDQLCRQQGIENKGFVPEFVECLESYDWPGNVRELINTLEKAILADREASKLYPVHIPRRIRLKSIQSSLDQKRNGETSPDRSPSMQESESISIQLGAGNIDSLPPLKKLREEVIETTESTYLRRLTQHTDHDLAKISKISGLSKPRIYALLKKYNIDRK